MVVSVNSSWKVPCGYFLLNGLTSAEKANLTKECPTKLHKMGGGGCEGGVFHVLWAHVAPVNVEVAWRQIVTR